jgi:hypothetical protein
MQLIQNIISVLERTLFGNVKCGKIKCEKAAISFMDTKK